MFQVVLVGVYQLNAGDDVPSSPTNVMDAQSADNHENKKSQNSQDDGGDQNSIVNMQGTAAAVNAKGQSAVYDGSEIGELDRQKLQEKIKAGEAILKTYNESVEIMNQKHVQGMSQISSSVNFLALDSHIADREYYTSLGGSTKLESGFWSASKSNVNDNLREALKTAITYVTSSISAQAVVKACAGQDENGNAHSNAVLEYKADNGKTVQDMIAMLQELEKVENYTEENRDSILKEHSDLVDTLQKTLTSYYENNNSQNSTTKSCEYDVYFDNAAFHEEYEKYAPIEYAHEIYEHHQTALAAAKANKTGNATNN